MQRQITGDDRQTNVFKVRKKTTFDGLDFF